MEIFSPLKQIVRYQSKYPRGGYIRFVGPRDSERFRAARDLTTNNTSNTEKINIIKQNCNNKRVTKGKKTSNAGKGTRFSFVCIFGWNWRYRYIIPMCKLVKDTRYRESANKKTTYRIKPIKYIDAYAARDIIMHAIKRNKKLLTRRYSFDGAATHTSTGKNINKYTQRPTLNMLEYYTKNRIKTMGFGGDNVPEQYKSVYGWGANSMDLQLDEKLFSKVKSVGCMYLSWIPEEFRTLKNTMKCFQRGYDETTQAELNNIWLHCNQNREECIAANGDYGFTFMGRPPSVNLNQKNNNNKNKKNKNKKIKK